MLLVFVLLPEIFSLTSFFFSLTFYICCTLYRVVFFLAFILQYSVPSKCWHISFKWSVFISHSLFPLFSPSSLCSLRRSRVLRDQSPDTTTLQLLFFFISLFVPSPLTFIVCVWIIAQSVQDFIQLFEFKMWHVRRPLIVKLASFCKTRAYKTASK